MKSQRKPQNHIDQFDRLPNEILAYMFNKLTQPQLIQIAGTNRQFANIANDVINRERDQELKKFSKLSLAEQFRSILMSAVDEYLQYDFGFFSFHGGSEGKQRAHAIQCIANTKGDDLLTTCMLYQALLRYRNSSLQPSILVTNFLIPKLVKYNKVQFDLKSIGNFSKDKKSKAFLACINNRENYFHQLITNIISKHAEAKLKTLNDAMPGADPTQTPPTHEAEQKNAAEQKYTAEQKQQLQQLIDKGHLHVNRLCRIVEESFANQKYLRHVVTYLNGLSVTDLLGGGTTLLQNIQSDYIDISLKDFSDDPGYSFYAGI